MVHLQYIHQQGGSVRVVVMMVVVTMMMSAATQNSLPRMDGWMDQVHDSCCTKYVHILPIYPRVAL